MIVANMCAEALRDEGYQVTVRKGLRQRGIYLPALEKGGKDNGVDLAPECVGTLLEFVNKGAGEASGNLGESVAKLRARLDGMGLTALTPSPAADQNIVPAIRQDVLDDDIRRVLDRVSAELNTEDLIQPNKRADVEKTDPERLAHEWLAEHGFTKE